MRQTYPPANGLQFDPDQRTGLYESFFVKANAPNANRALWLRFTLWAPAPGAHGEANAEVWAFVFNGDNAQHVGGKQRFALEAVERERDPINLRFGDCSFSDGHTVGALTTETGASLRWNLTLKPASPDAAPLYMLPHPRFYHGGFPRSKTITPYPHALLNGTLTVDGHSLAVENWHGMQGHNWGKEHAHRYAWVHCNAFAGHPETRFEAVSASLKLGPVTTPWLTLMVLHHEGATYDFRPMRQWVNRSVRTGLYSWQVHGKCVEGIVEARFWAEARDMIGLTYESPNNAVGYCLNSKIARAQITITFADGRAPVTLESNCKAALELMVRDPNHGVPLLC